MKVGSFWSDTRPKALDISIIMMKPRKASSDTSRPPGTLLAAAVTSAS
jgi:hypothetical protein